MFVKYMCAGDMAYSTGGDLELPAIFRKIVFSGKRLKVLKSAVPFGNRKIATSLFMAPCMRLPLISVTQGIMGFSHAPDAKFEQSYIIEIQKNSRPFRSP